MPFVEIDDLRWSHDKIYDHFKDKVSIYETVVHLVLGHVSVDDIPPLRVVKIGHLMHSLSNRRGVHLQNAETRQSSFRKGS